MLLWLTTLPTTNSATHGGHVLLLQLPAGTSQVMATVLLALMIIGSTAILRQALSARRWMRILNSYADRDIARARRRQLAQENPPAAHVRKPPPPRPDDPHGPSPL